MRFDDLFTEGIIVGGEVKARTMFFDLPSQHHVGGIWKHVSLTDLRLGESPPGEYPEVPVPGLPTLRDSFTLYYGFDLHFVRFTEKPDRGWGPVRTRGDHRRQPDPRALLPQRGPRRLQPIRATPDIQWLRPGAGAIAENAFVYGVRINITF